MRITNKMVDAGAAVLEDAYGGDPCDAHVATKVYEAMYKVSHPVPHPRECGCHECCQEHIYKAAADAR